MDDDLSRLATLDPARGREPTEAEWSRSRARLAAAMTEPAEVRRPRARRMVIGLAAATVLAAGAALAGPALTPDGDVAYASWTPVPENLPDAESLATARDCAASWAGGDLPAGEVVLAERRGDTVLLIMWLRGGPLISCSSLGSGEPAGASRLSDDGDQEPPLPPAGRVSLAGGMGATGDGDTWYSEASGRVGPGVTGVDITLPDGATVRASVRQGWWAAWWPGHEAGEADAVRIVVHSGGEQRSYRPGELG